jgi:glycerol-3-phosphate acyltransferase PlsX
LQDLIEEEIRSKPLTTLGGLLARPAFRQVKKRTDYREYGGGPLLGVDGIVIVAHGRSDSLAIKNAIRVAKQAVEADTLNAIRGDIAQSLATPSEE